MSDIGNFFAGAMNYLGQKEANATNLAIARENNEWNERMWHMQNAYNSPAEQMARYRAAGLNPNLIYGNGSNGNATNFPTAQPVSVQNTRLGDAFQGLDFLGYFYDIMKKREELKTQKATTANINADTQNKSNEASEWNVYGMLSAKAKLDNEIAQYEYKLGQTNLSKTQTSYYREQIDNLKFERAKIQGQISLMEREYEKLGEDILLKRNENLYNIHMYPKLLEEKDLKLIRDRLYSDTPKDWFQFYRLGLHGYGQLNDDFEDIYSSNRLMKSWYSKHGNRSW